MDVNSLSGTKCARVSFVFLSANIVAISLCSIAEGGCAVLFYGLVSDHVAGTTV